MERDENNCPVSKGLFVFEGKWNGRILHELMKTPVKRFGELKKVLPNISNTMLTAALKELEEKGLVHREQYNEMPPRVEYSLTEAGRAVMPIFDALEDWCLTYLKD